MTINEPMFIPSTHKFGLSTASIHDSMERDFTIITRIRPDWENLKEGQDAGIVIRNGKHAGLQISKENGYAFAKSIIWVTETDNDDDAEPIILISQLGRIEDNERLDLLFHHSHSKKSLELMVSKIDGLEPYVQTINYSGRIIDYKNAWLWIGCCFGYSGIDDVLAGHYKGDMEFLGLFGSEFTDEEFSLMFSDEFNYSNYEYWTDKNIIAYSDFKIKTPYKYKDISNNGNNICTYKEEWGDMF
tara:strand:+ start:335 stop:1066 length:732 start_codon:yes stop_codon:yes gene_type:complete